MSGRINRKTGIASLGINKNIYSALLERCQERRRQEKLAVTLIGFK